MGAVLINRVPAPYSRNRERNDDPMSAQVIVSGRSREAGGLKESLARFTQHQKVCSDAVLNISDIGIPDNDPQFPNGRDENDPRPEYDSAKNQWPRMIYHAQHGELIVHSEAELKEAKRQQYRDEPFPKPQIEVLSPEIEKKKLKDENDQLRGQMARLEDKLNKLMEAQETSK